MPMNLNANRVLMLAMMAVSLTVPAVRAQADNAEAYYIANIEPIVQSRCIACHVSGGVAAFSGLQFTASASSNHQAMESYVNTPSLGAKGPVLLSNVSGGSGHPGGVQLPEGSADYAAVQTYVSLLSTAPEPAPETVFRAALEEPVDGAIHTGVGNLRGWALATDGVSKIEVFVDGAYVFDAPYGGQRSDVGGAFPDVIGSDRSGFSLAFNYSDLAAGEHTITIEAATEMGERLTRQSTFTVVKFAQNFISAPDAVNLNAAACSVSGDEISITDATVDGQLYDFIMKWRTAEQGFEIIEIR